MVTASRNTVPAAKLITAIRRRRVRRLLIVILLGSMLFVAGLSLRNSIHPSGIVIHHLAVPAWAVKQYSVAEIDRIHRERGFGAFYWGKTYHVAYHFLILPDGSIEVGRPEHLRGAHAPGYNNYLGICLVGDFSTIDNPKGDKGPSEPTSAQRRSLVRLVRQLKKKYSITQSQVLLHREVNPNTQCPGDRFPKALLDELRKN